MRNMRIKHKYLRNRLVKTNTRKRVKAFVGGEFSYKAYCPSWIYSNPEKYSSEAQLKDHQKYIDEWWVRGIISGGKGYHAPKWYRKVYERAERRAIKVSISKIMNGYEDIEMPYFRHEADWDWF